MLSVDQWVQAAQEESKRIGFDPLSGAQIYALKSFFEGLFVDLSECRLTLVAYPNVRVGPNDNSCVELDFFNGGVDAWVFREGEVLDREKRCTPERFVALLAREGENYG